MKEHLLLLLSSAVFAIPIILIGYLFNIFLAKWGYIRPSKESPFSWIATYLLILGKQIWYKELPWQIFIPAILLGIVLSANRYELNQSFKKGRWWWKPKKAKNKHLSV
jgi:hypothetical protein